jgi:single-strand DNA-binding protein
MKPGIIETAFAGHLSRDPERRTAQSSGREFAVFGVCCGDAPNIQWVDVACFGPAVDAAMTLVKGDMAYIEGKLSLRTWQNQDGTSRQQLSVVASVVQPLGKIGERKPKATRKTTAARMRSKSAVVNAPLGFDDQLPI